jgi:hypothetical protein
MFRLISLLGTLLILGAAETGFGAPEEPVLPDSARFGRHLVPLFSKLGCNSGSCHGAVKGQNGFRLALFGADPAADHVRIVREAGGRRIDLLDPDASLLLLKATGRMPHHGGKRFDVGSPEYRLLRGWIAAGAPLDEVDAAPRLIVEPASLTLKAGQVGRLRVRATFGDNVIEDVTAFCSFDTRDATIAHVDVTGNVKALGVGDTIVLIRYRGQPLMAQVLVPGEPRGGSPAITGHNAIDTHVLAKLRQLNIEPAELCDDATFLRRVSLDVTGALPEPAEVRAFLADKDPGKRTKKIEELLARSGHAALWATKFCDLLRPAQFDQKGGLNENASARRVYEWLRARVAANIPYDQLAERILLATSREGRAANEWVKEIQAFAAEDGSKVVDAKTYANRKTLDLYWQRPGGLGVKGTLQVAHAFLGLRLECAQCHRHPHDVWQQDDLLSFANFFTSIGGAGGAPSAEVAQQVDAMMKEAKAIKDQVKSLNEKAKDKSLAKDEVMKLQAEAKSAGEKANALEAVAKRLKATEVRVLDKTVFASVTSTLGSQKSETFRLLGDKKSVKLPAGQDPRAMVMAWMRRSDNPYFARALVNRVWAHYFGRGIIDPPDHLSSFNPPTHPELLAALAADFVQHGYDLRHLHRLILTSRTYQQSAKTNASSRLDTANYASFYLRRLPAEVLVDAVNHATGGQETYPPELFVPAGARAIEVAGSAGSGQKVASLHYAFQIFGRPIRSLDVQCDCERDASATVVQALFLANHPSIREKIANPQGRVAKIAKDFADPDKAVEEMYLWTLSRPPTAEEAAACRAHVQASGSPKEGLEDVMWGLLNTREFVLNH